MASLPKHIRPRSPPPQPPLKVEADQLAPIIAIVQAPLPPEHGLHGVVDPAALGPLAARLALHYIHCTIMLRPYISSMQRLLESGEPLPTPLEPWVQETMGELEGFIALEYLAPWFAEENDRVLQSLVPVPGFICVQTVAPQQLVMQWLARTFMRVAAAVLPWPVSPTTAEELYAFRAEAEAWIQQQAT